MKSKYIQEQIEINNNDQEQIGSNFEENRALYKNLM